MSFFMKLLLCCLFVLTVYSSCPGGCSGHGTCGANGVCTCASITSTGWGSALNAGYTGADCSLRTCPVGASIQTIPVVFRGTVYPHPIDGQRRLDEVASTISPNFPIKNTYKVESEDLKGLMNVEGGILKCSRLDNSGYLGTANVLAFDGEKIAIIQYNFNLTKAAPIPLNDTEPEEDEYDYNDYIGNTVCSIFSTRNDLSQYKSIKGEGSTINPWLNYAEMLNLMKWSNEVSTSEEDSTTSEEKEEKLQVACYKTKLADDDKETTRSYVFYGDLTVTVGVTDVEFKIEGVTLDNYTVCYILAKGNGDVISIEESDLSKKLKKEGDKWYYEIAKEGNPIVETTGPTIGIKVSQDTIDNIIADLKNQSIAATGGSDETDLSVVSQPKVTIPLPTTPQEKAIIIAISMPGTPVVIDFGDAGKLPNTIIGVKPTNGNPRRLLNENGRELEDPISFDMYKGMDYVFADAFPASGITDFHIDFEKVGGVHSPIECSGQGLCNRESGECQCYNGFTGEACQRMSCPNDCNNHGKCVSSLATSYTAYGEGNGMIYRCECDNGYRGADCSLKECPSDISEVTDRDCSNNGLCDYSSGLCNCFAGFYGEACQYSIGTA